METLTIEIPKGYEIENFDKSTGVVSFKEKPKDIKEIIQNFSDVLKYHEIDEDDFNELNDGLDDDEIAYRQLKLIVSAYNLKELPNFSNSNQIKYEPRFYMGSGFSYHVYVFWLTHSHVGSRLCFLNRENLKDAVSKFLNIYKVYLTRS